MDAILWLYFIVAAPLMMIILLAFIGGFLPRGGHCHQLPPSKLPEK